MDFPYPYVCTLSPQCRAATKLLGAQDTMRRIAEGAVSDVASREDVAASLKIPYNGFRAMRQVDIRADATGPIVLKCFVGWNPDLNSWHVFIEGLEEKHWEKENHQAPIGVN